ncbi:MAG: thiamine pyrophosphate-dependent enzyme [Pseudomonadota bacterium]
MAVAPQLPAGTLAAHGVEPAAPPRAADAIAERLRAHGVRHVYAVAGESYLDLLDALHGDVGPDVVTCRHEAAATNMAEATAKLTGRPGVALVTRGPGLAHASIGVHTAQQDATPLVLFVGEIAREDRFRGAFQEVDLGQVFGELAKGWLRIDDANRAPELVDRAFQLATSGRPGPVVVGLPEDVLAEPCRAPLVAPAAAPVAGVDARAVDAIVERLAAAERPLLWVGGSLWTPEGVDALVRLAERWQLPVGTTFRRKDHFPNHHSLYAGELGFGTSPALQQRVRDADLLLALGAPLGDVETGGYRWLDRATARARLVHVHRDAGTLSAVWPASLAVHAPPEAVAVALAGRAPSVAPRWLDWTRAARAAQAAFVAPVATVGRVNLSECWRELRRQLPADAIVTNGAGNYAAWLHRFYEHRAFRTQLAPGSGAMGYAVPAAIAAKLAHPEREGVCGAGDGCFLMSSQELATAAQRRTKLVFVVVDNGAYGTIRMHQQARYPGRVVATDLQNPDFVAYAHAFGLPAWRVTATAEFGPALEAARAHDGPSLLHLVTDVEDISPGRRLSELGR